VPPGVTEGAGVKIVTVLVRPHGLDAVRRALERHAVLGMTITEVSGHEPGHVEVHKGARVEVDLVPCLRVETVVDDDIVDRLLDQLLENLDGTDGQIWVRQVDLVLRVRTGEMGRDAV
jgi:nitrogen regulatory protein P-II 1